MKALHVIAFVLVVVGGLNWGLVGAGNWNVVNMLLGAWPVVERIVYVLVGVSAIALAFTHWKECKHCETTAAPVNTVA